MSAPIIFRGIVLLGTVVFGGILAYFAYRNLAEPEAPHEAEPQPEDQRSRSPNRNENNKNRCTACLQDTNPRNREFLKCNHVFHKDCYQELILRGERSCPRCFRNISQSEVDEILGANENRNNCAICLRQISHRDIKILNCNHNFHEDCVTDLVLNGGNKCPSCRKFISDREIDEIKKESHQVGIRRSLMI